MSVISTEEKYDFAGRDVAEMLRFKINIRIISMRMLFVLIWLKEGASDGVL
jgi:hypothetical protein